MITFDELFQRDYGSAKIGVFGCGCWFYWDQFEGKSFSKIRLEVLDHCRKQLLRVRDEVPF